MTRLMIAGGPRVNALVEARANGKPKKEVRPVTNRFVGECLKCKGKVAAGEGEVWKFRGKWYTRHIACSATGQANVARVQLVTLTAAEEKQAEKWEESGAGCEAKGGEFRQVARQGFQDFAVRLNLGRMVRVAA